VKSGISLVFKVTKLRAGNAVRQCLQLNFVANKITQRRQRRQPHCVLNCACRSAAGIFERFGGGPDGPVARAIRKRFDNQVKPNPTPRRIGCRMEGSAISFPYHGGSVLPPCLDNIDPGQICGVSTRRVPAGTSACGQRTSLHFGCQLRVLRPEPGPGSESPACHRACEPCGHRKTRANA
jgi:hypothetical protein